MKKVIPLLLAFVFTLLVLSPTTYAANWKWITSTDTTGFFVDISNIKKERFDSSKTIYYTTWVKYVYNQGGVQEVLDTRMKYDLPIDGYENLSHSIFREEFQYKNGSKYVKYISRIDYNNNGKALDSYSDQYAQFDEIFPETIAESIFDTVVKNS